MEPLLLRSAARWLYSLLCHVEEPLDPDTSASLYALTGENMGQQ